MMSMHDTIFGRATAKAGCTEAVLSWRKPLTESWQSHNCHFAVHVYCMMVNYKNNAKPSLSCTLSHWILQICMKSQTCISGNMGQVTMNKETLAVISNSQTAQHQPLESILFLASSVHSLFLQVLTTENSMSFCLVSQSSNMVALDPSIYK